MMPKKYPQEVIEFIYANYKGISSEELGRRIQEKFGIEITPTRLKGWKAKYGLKSGYSKRFEIGNIPANKGKKIEQAPGSVATRFKPGHDFVRYREIGHERKGDNGYIYVKVREPEQGERTGANYIPKHRAIWEAEHGPLKAGECVIFKDGNKKNFDLENLAVVSRREHVVMNTLKLRTSDASLTEAGIAVAKLKVAIADRKGKTNGI